MVPRWPERGNVLPSAFNLLHKNSWHPVHSLLSAQHPESPLPFSQHPLEKVLLTCCLLWNFKRQSCFELFSFYFHLSLLPSICVSCKVPGISFPPGVSNALPLSPLRNCVNDGNGKPQLLLQLFTLTEHRDAWGKSCLPEPGCPILPKIVRCDHCCSWPRSRMEMFFDWKVRIVWIVEWQNC